MHLDVLHSAAFSTPYVVLKPILGVHLSNFIIDHDIFAAYYQFLYLLRIRREL